MQSEKMYQLKKKKRKHTKEGEIIIFKYWNQTKGLHEQRKSSMWLRKEKYSAEDI